MNLKQLGLGVMQYMQDYDETLPSATGSSASSKDAGQTGPYGWADAIYPYVKNEQVYLCPVVELHQVRRAFKTVPSITDYYYNSNLSKLPAVKLSSPRATLLFADGNDGSVVVDARYNRSSLPTGWLTDRAMPTFRHIIKPGGWFVPETRGATYAFTDGHVKLLTPDQISTESVASNPYTFATR